MSANNLAQLELRVSRIEEELRQLRGQLTEQPNKRGWEAIVGSFKGDKVFAEIVRLGRQIRRADRPQVNGKRSRRKGTKTKPRKNEKG